MPPAANPTERFRQQVNSSGQRKHNLFKDLNSSNAPGTSEEAAHTIKTQASQPSKQPRFKVNVNGRFFEGFESVTLNKRVVLVDGANVGQAKMVIVLGEQNSTS